jgi:hypothetical protein
MRHSILLALVVLPALMGRNGGAGGQGQTPSPTGKGFTDITKGSGVADPVNRHYARNPKWWLSGLHLLDFDGDGKLDLFLSAHGRGGALAALGDGKGHIRPAPGSYPPTEIHLAYDADEDGRVDVTMTFQDGGGKWWRNRSKPGTLAFAGTGIERGTNTARRQAMVDLDRDGKVDWLRGAPGRIVVERGDGKGGLRQGPRDPHGQFQPGRGPVPAPEH